MPLAKHLMRSEDPMEAIFSYLYAPKKRATPSYRRYTKKKEEKKEDLTKEIPETKIEAPAYEAPVYEAPALTGTTGMELGIQTPAVTLPPAPEIPITAPEVIAPEIPIEAPEIALPAAPEITAPRATLPELEAPVLPDLTVPEITPPKIAPLDVGIETMPLPSVDVGIGGVELPEITLPEMVAPEIPIPEITAPALPEFAAPDIGIRGPDLGLGGISLPTPKLPDIHLGEWGDVAREALPGIGLEDGRVTFKPTLEQQLGVGGEVAKVIGRAPIEPVAKIGEMLGGAIEGAKGVLGTVGDVTSQLAPWITAGKLAKTIIETPGKEREIMEQQKLQRKANMAGQVGRYTSILQGGDEEALESLHGELSSAEGQYRLKNLQKDFPDQIGAIKKWVTDTKLMKEHGTTDVKRIAQMKQEERDIKKPETAKRIEGIAKRVAQGKAKVEPDSPFYKQIVGLVDKNKEKWQKEYVAEETKKAEAMQKQRMEKAQAKLEAEQKKALRAAQIGAIKGKGKFSKVSDVALEDTMKHMQKLIGSKQKNRLSDATLRKKVSEYEEELDVRRVGQKELPEESKKWTKIINEGTDKQKQALLKDLSPSSKWMKALKKYHPESATTMGKWRDQYSEYQEQIKEVEVAKKAEIKRLAKEEADRKATEKAKAAEETSLARAQATREKYAKLAREKTAKKKPTQPTGTRIFEGKGDFQDFLAEQRRRAATAARERLSKLMGG